jgi:AraC-like DNA-binding protein
LVGEINRYKGNSIDGSFNFSELKNHSANLTSNYYSIKYVSKGSENYFLPNNNIVALNTSEILIVKPNQDINVIVDSKEYNKGICIYLNPDIVNSKLKHTLSEELIPSFRMSVINTELENFYKNINLENDTDIVLQKFIESFNLFLSSKVNKVKNLNTSKKDTSIYLWEKLEQSKMFILNNFGKQISLEDIADSAQLSKFHYSRVFKDFHSITPNAYLKEVRLNEAKNLLKKSNLNFDEIALKCGFNDIKYLKKCLKKHHN